MVVVFQPAIVLTPGSPRATNFRERPCECQVPAPLRELWLPTSEKGLGAQLEHILLTRFLIVQKHHVHGYKCDPCDVTVPDVNTAADPHSLLKHLQPKRFRASYGSNPKHSVSLKRFHPQN